MSRILCVEDEAAILRLLEVILARDGHEALTAPDGAAALAALKAGNFDAVLLDLGLPDRDGLEMIGAIHAVAPVPVIVVSAREDVREKVTALDLGAADYLTKPFDGDELLARLRAALRASGVNRARDGVIVHGCIRIDTARRVVTVDGRPAPLTPKEFAVLTALAEVDGRVLTHGALLEAVWGPAHRRDVEYLRVVIRALRLKLEDDPSQPALIRNDPGIGYRLG